MTWYSKCFLCIPEVNAARALQSLPPDELENLRFDGLDPFESALVQKRYVDSGGPRSHDPELIMQGIG